MAASAVDHLEIPEVPKECTWKDMSIKRKRNVVINLHCERNYCRKIVSDLIVCTWMRMY